MPEEKTKPGDGTVALVLLEPGRITNHNKYLNRPIMFLLVKTHDQLQPPLLPGQHPLADDSTGGLGPCRVTYANLSHWYYHESIELDPLTYLFFEIVLSFT